MMAGALRRLSDWAAQTAFRELTVGEAAQRLQELAPRYPGPFDQPVEICVNGCRWFAEEVEAVADAIHRAGRRPHRAKEPLGGPDWGTLRNAAGLWAVTGPMGGGSHRIARVARSSSLTSPSQQLRLRPLLQWI